MSTSAMVSDLENLICSVERRIQFLSFLRLILFSFLLGLQKVRDSAIKKLEKREDKVTDTAGVESVLQLCVGAHVMLRWIFNVTMGLVNGALGVVVNIRQQLDGSISRIEIQFDNITQVKVNSLLQNAIYVEFNVYCFSQSVSSDSVIRDDDYKSQGLSLSDVLVDVGNSIFQEGMSYVALSRVRTLNGLHLINLNLVNALPANYVSLN